MSYQTPQMQIAPMTKMVKALIIVNVVVWAFCLIMQYFGGGSGSAMEYIGLVPARVIEQFWIWQFFTYMFVHFGVSHIFFNMLVLWWCGGELEQRWGPKFFLSYFLVCGAGAGFIYVLGTLGYYLFTGKVLNLASPLVGASGATYGLLLAYGLIFGDRVIHFMMLFPMQARWFVAILGAIELMTLLDSGAGGQTSQTSNLAHLAGIGVGFVYLAIVARYRARGSKKGGKDGRRLKLVVDNERRKPAEPGQGPKYWN